MMKVKFSVAVLAPCLLLAMVTPAGAQFKDLKSFKKVLETAKEVLEEPNPTPQPQSPTRPVPPRAPAVSSSAEVPISAAPVTLPSQEWECNSGFPDAEFANLKIFDLQQSGERTLGKYEIRDIPGLSADASNALIERGSVRIEGEIYTFSTSYFKNRDEYRDTFLLSPNFKIAKDEGEGTPILAEVLSPDRREAFQDEEFDGMEQGCALPGTWSAQ